MITRHLRSSLINANELLFESPVQEREKKVSKLEETGFTEEELYEQQQALFAKSKAAFAAHSGSGDAGPSGAAD